MKVFFDTSALVAAVVDYRDALLRVAGLGLRSGVVYDALHLGCAEKASYERLVSFNTKDF